MGETTGIAWCDHTFNPWISCTKVHVGCDNCYAEKLATSRLGRGWGPGAERRVTVDDNWRQPSRWARDAAEAGERRRVFCASLADVLDEEAPKEAQARLWQLIRETAHVNNTLLVQADGVEWSTAGGLDWLLLTKRPERWELIPADVRPLVWLGTSISDQRTADEWVPRLLRAKGFRLRFLSVEPLIGPVDFNRCKAWHPSVNDHYLEGVSWVIVGGESGPKARTCDLAWLRSLVQQCQQAKVPCFLKQLGSDPVAHGDLPMLLIKDKKGGEPDEWPSDLRVREFPVVAGR